MLIILNFFCDYQLNSALQKEKQINAQDAIGQHFTKQHCTAFSSLKPEGSSNSQQEAKKYQTKRIAKHFIWICQQKVNFPYYF